MRAGGAQGPLWRKGITESTSFRFALVCECVCDCEDDGMMLVDSCEMYVCVRVCKHLSVHLCACVHTHGTYYYVCDRFSFYMKIGCSSR